MTNMYIVTSPLLETSKRPVTKLRFGCQPSIANCTDSPSLSLDLGNDQPSNLRRWLR